MDGAGGGPPALGAQDTGAMYELLRLYRDRDARDAKIRSLEQALAEARRATPVAPGAGAGADQLNKSAIQVQQMEESLKAQHRQLEELQTTNAAHMATIDAMKRTQEDSYATIDELRKSKEAQEAIAEQLQQRNASYQHELEQLRVLKVELEGTVVEAQRRRSEVEEQLKTTVASANGDGNTLREELLRMTQEHAVLQEKLQQMERQFQAGASNSKQVAALNVELEAMRKSASHMQVALSEKSALVEEKEKALGQVQAKVDIITKRTETVSAQLGEANSKIQQLRGDAHQRAVELEKTVSRNKVLQSDMDSLKRQLDLAHTALGEHKRASQQATEEGEKAKKGLAAASARVSALESDLKDTRSKAEAGVQRINALTAEVKKHEVAAQDLERERTRLSQLLEAKTAEIAALSKNSDGATSELRAQLQKLTAALAERSNEIAILQRIIAERDGLLKNHSAELQQKTQELLAATNTHRELRSQYDALQTKLEQVVPKDQHDVQISHMESQLNTTRVKLADAEARVAELDAQILVLKNPHLGTPTPSKRQDSPVSPMPEPNASKEEIQLVKELRTRVRTLESEKSMLMRRASSSGSVAREPQNAIGECKMHNTIADVLSTAKDKYDAGRIWVTNMYTSDDASLIPQSDVFLAYHHDLHSHPRLSAVDFFKVCEGAVPGVHIEKGAGSTYFVKGMSKRRVPARAGGDTLSPRSSTVPSVIGVSPAPVPPPTPTPAPASDAASVVPEEKPRITVPLDEKKAVKVHSEQSIQYDIMDNPAVAASACHMRQKPWVGDINLDFKLWLRHRVLGLTDMACMHPVARTSAQALRRYLFAKSAIEKVQSLGWETEVQDVFRVPADSREYRNATFNMDSVREAVNVSTKLWEADVDTFARGVDGRELILAWLRAPEDPILLAKFGNMTRHEFDRYKREGEEPRKKKKRPRESSSDAVAKKARLESSGAPGSKTPIVIGSSPPPPPSSQT